MTYVEVWTMGRIAAEKGFDQEAALRHFTEVTMATREDGEIFVDGFQNVNRDYAEDLDRAALKNRVGG